MSLYEFNQEEYDRNRKEESREQGRQEGYTKAKAESRKEILERDVEIAKLKTQIASLIAK